MLLQEFGGALMGLDSPSTLHLLVPSLPRFPLHPRPGFGSRGSVWQRGKSAESSRDEAGPSRLSPRHPPGFPFQQHSGFIPNRLCFGAIIHRRRKNWIFVLSGYGRAALWICGKKGPFRARFWGLIFVPHSHLVPVLAGMIQMILKDI